MILSYIPDIVVISAGPIAESPCEVIPRTEGQEGDGRCRIEVKSADGVESPSDGPVTPCDEDDALWNAAISTSTAAAALGDSLAQPERVLHLGLAEVDDLQRVQLTSERVEEGGPVVVAGLGIPDDEEGSPLGRTLWPRDLLESRRMLYNVIRAEAFI